jgi:hypothetical protein
VEKQGLGNPNPATREKLKPLSMKIYRIIYPVRPVITTIFLLWGSSALAIPSEPPALLTAAPAALPSTYPDSEAFAHRRQAIVDALAGNDLDQWRRGYFAGGDPGKYLPGAAMARLLVNPADPDALRLMNDARSPKENYHFAALNWARFLPLFGSTLTAETRATLAASAAKYTNYLKPSGTENHRTMNLAAANVIPHFLADATHFGGRPRSEAIDSARDQLRAYVKTLYVGGQGEWDSPTYLMFTVHGLLNIYDFSPDPETRLIAAAGLDLLVAGQALKYRDGIFTGPNQRGYYDRADQTAWLWWGGSTVPSSPDLKRWLFSIHPATSSWRPNATLTRIARKQLHDLPVTLANTRANYWFGQNIPIVPVTHRETLHLSRSFTLGSLSNGNGSQFTRIHLTATDGAAGPVALTGGHPRKSDHTGKKLDEVTYRDGGGRYDQTVQFGPLLVNLTRLPADETLDHVFVSLPRGAAPTEHPGRDGEGRRWVFRAGDTWICITPLGGTATITPPDLNPKEIAAREKTLSSGKSVAPLPSILRITGRPHLGFALLAVEASAHADASDLLAWMDQSYAIDATTFALDAVVGVTLPDGSSATIRHNPEADRATVTPALPAPTGTYGGPFVTLKDSILTVSDGTDGYRVDFTGQLPAYQPIK